MGDAFPNAKDMCLHLMMCDTLAKSMGQTRAGAPPPADRAPEKKPLRSVRWPHPRDHGPLTTGVGGAAEQSGPCGLSTAFSTISGTVETTQLYDLGGSTF